MAVIEKTKRAAFEAVLADTFYDVFKVAGQPIPAEKLPELKRFIDKLADEFKRQVKIEAINVAKISAEMTDKAFKNAQASHVELERRIGVVEGKVDKINAVLRKAETSEK
jgi:hypothetical protein